jgi:hypothetical protein
MEEQDKRIQNILGRDCERNNQNACRYFEYLKEAIKRPCLLSGREDFLWEERYVFGGWDNKEYEELKKVNPSYTDEYKLIELLEPEYGNDEIIAKVKRLSDQKIFRIGLSWLECIDFEKENNQLLNDYSVWHVNY